MTRADDVERDQRNKPPGPIVLAMTILSVAVLLCIHYDWQPASYGNLTGADHFFYGAPALLVLALTGLVWAIRTLYVVGEDRRWSWWIVAAPSVVIAAVAVGMIWPPPTFDEARPEFERIARQVLAEPGTRLADIEICGFEISYVRMIAADEVQFIDADGYVFTTVSGWVYSPNRMPNGSDNREFSSTHLGGPWYKFAYSW
ncbi:DUF1109 domain-containing protein [Rhodococcus oryzae]|uniref:DUF1109 domain-containing protein n=1 Tax=Rhodococcus oryzae TaxID=2571143 RepID=UPI0037916584